MNSLLQASTMKEGRKEWHSLLAILVFASLLRILGIGFESFWNDELSSLHRSSYETLGEVVELGVIPDVHPPGYQILLYFVERWVGNDETALRLPSAIAGIATVLIVYLLGMKLFNRRVAFLASAMMSVSPAHIWLSQEARPYSILIFLTTLAVYLLIRYWKNDNDRVSLMILSLVFVLLEYLHYFGLLVCALAGSWLLFHSLRTKRNRAAVLLCLALPVMAYLPWIPIMAEQSGGTSYISSPGIMSIVYAFIEIAGWSKPLLAVFAALAALPVISLVRRKDIPGRAGLLLLLAWIALPLAVSLAVSWLITPVYTARNLMIVLPAVMLLQSLACMEFMKHRVAGIVTGAGVTALMLVQLVFVREHYTVPHRNQFREAAEYVAVNFDENGDAVILASAWNEAYFDYYLRRAGSGAEVDLRAAGEEDIPAVEDLIDLRNPGEVWLLWGHVEPDEGVLRILESSYAGSEYEPLLGAGVWHFTGRE